MADTYQLGMDAKLYYGPEGTATGALTELSSIKDLSLNLASDTTDVTTRANAGFKATVSTLRTIEATFQIQWNTGDAGFEAIRDAWLTPGALLRLLIADMDKATVGAQGPLADFSVTGFTRNEELAEAIMADVTVMLSVWDQWYETP